MQTSTFSGSPTFVDQLKVTGCVAHQHLGAPKLRNTTHNITFVGQLQVMDCVEHQQVGTPRLRNQTRNMIFVGQLKFIE